MWLNSHEICSLPMKILKGYLQKRYFANAQFQFTKNILQMVWCGVEVIKSYDFFVICARVGLALKFLDRMMWYISKTAVVDVKKPILDPVKLMQIQNWGGRCGHFDKIPWFLVLVAQLRVWVLSAPSFNSPLTPVSTVVHDIYFHARLGLNIGVSRGEPPARL